MFLQVAAATPLLGAPVEDPKYKVVTPFKPAAKPGMPGPYPGQVVRVHSEKSLDIATDKVDRAVVKQMLSAGMKALTGDADEQDAWRRFISPTDVVGIKVNCSGAPRICSAPEIVGGIAENLVKIGVLPPNIYVYERFENQIQTVPYAKFLPEGAHIWAAETSRGSILGYDPHIYLETSFFGEEDTRSNLVRLVSEKLTKIINVPNMKEHQAAGVTGCLKNIAYGNFSNMDRSHRFEQTNTQDVHRHAGVHRAGALARRAQYHGRSARRLAPGAVQPRGALPLLSQADDVRHRPGRDGPQADRPDRGEAQGGRRDVAVGALARVPRRQSRSQVQPLHPRARPRGVCFDARARRLRREQNQTAGDRAVMLLLVAAVLPRLFWDAGPETAPALREAGIERIAVPAAQSDAWKGVTGITVEVADPARAIKLVAPSVDYRANQGSASRSPWLNSNGWRFVRQPQGAVRVRREGPAGARWPRRRPSAYGANALIRSDAAGLKPLGQMLAVSARRPGRRHAAGGGYRVPGRRLVRSGRSHEPDDEGQPAVPHRQSAGSRR